MLISKATRMCYGSAPQREWRNPQTAIISAFRATRWIKTCGCWRISEVYYRRVMCDCSLPAPESIRIAVELSSDSAAEPHRLQSPHPQGWWVLAPDGRSPQTSSQNWQYRESLN